MRRKLFRIVGLLILLSIILFCATSEAFALKGVGEQSVALASECTLFVSLDGSDDNPGTESEPFRTIRQAARVVEAGDVVCVREGRYGGFYIDEKFGTEEKPIVFQPYPGEHVIIDSKVGNVEGIAVLIQDVHHLVVQGFEIMDTTSLDLDFQKLDPNKPEELAIIKAHRHRSGIRLAAWDGGGKYITLQNLNVHHTCGLAFTSNSNIDYIFVLNSDIHHTGSYGMYLVANHHVIRGNTIHHNVSHGMNMGNAQQHFNDAIIEKNFIYANGSDSFYHVSSDTIRRSGDGIVMWHGTRNVIRNNIVFHNKNWGIRSNSDDNLEGDVDNIIENNTVYANGYQGLYTYDGQQDVFRNNISFGNRGEGGYPGDAFIGSGNASITNLLGVDPLFVDPTIADFHLSPESPAIDAGNAIATVTEDFDGTSRPQGGGWDIGAYEYVDLPVPTFADVPFDHWAHDYIEVLYQEGYVAGCNLEPLLYCPEDIMTRAESAVFVERGVHGAEYLPTQPTEQIFVDVPLNEWFAKWATSLWEDGYTDGCSTDPLMYCPLQQHTRTEGCVFFLRMMHGAEYVPPEPEGIFSDIALDWWGAKWVEAAYNAGIIPACETDPELKFCPNDPLDRAMGATMMVQAKDLVVP